jgi:hypothetical protein
MPAFLKILCMLLVIPPKTCLSDMFHHKVHHYLKAEIPLLEFMNMCLVTQPHPNLAQPVSIVICDISAVRS